MRRFIICAALISAVLLFPSDADAQSSAPTGQAPVARNLVHGELLGSGGLYSLNYERRFARRWTARVGFSAYNGSSELSVDESVTLVLFPVMVNTLMPGGTHNLELGLGPVFGYASATSENYGSLNGFGIGNLSANIAYRYQPPSGGFSFRLGLLPNYSSDSINIWLSLSLGYAF